MAEHIRKSHNVNCMLYHLVCPAKYRRQIFTPAVESTLKEVCLQFAECYDMHFLEIGADQDHVHFLIQSVPMVLPKRIVQITKSITAREIFKRHPEVKKLLWGGEFWTKGYYINTVGVAGNEAVIKKYVQDQGKMYKQIYRGQLTLFDGMV
ncbi:MAG: IS200/IS605 family transposase [Candidatus Jorgensenbacteria bacterium]